MDGSFWKNMERATVVIYVIAVIPARPVRPNIGRNVCVYVDASAGQPAACWEALCMLASVIGGPDLCLASSNKSEGTS